MAHEIFNAISDFRVVLNTETDADSPINETSYGALRKAVETVIMLTYNTGHDGSLTADPSNSTDGQVTDTAATWSADEHNSRTLLITSGAGKGNIYTIDDTLTGVAGSTSFRLDCAGDNLYADGVRSGDDYRVLYDLKVSSSGHNHDGVNSPLASMPNGMVNVANVHSTAPVGEKVGSGFGNVNELRIYVPQGAKYILPSFCLFSTSGAALDARLSAGGNLSAQVSISSTTPTWADCASGINISTFTPGWTTFNVQLSYAGIGAGYITGYSLVLFNDSGT